MKTWEAREHENNLSHYSNNFEARSIGREIREPNSEGKSSGRDIRNPESEAQTIGREIRKPNCEAQSIDNNNNRFEYEIKVCNIVFLLLTMMERGKMPFRTV
jgi:hypothetical protein